MLGVMQMHPRHECLDDGRDALSFISCFRRVKIIFVKPNPQKLSQNWVNYEQFIAFVAEADDKFDEIWCEMLIGTGCLRLQNPRKTNSMWRENVFLHSFG